MDTNKDSTITRARKWIGCRIVIIARGAVGQLMHMIRVVDKTILGIEKMHAGRV